MERIKQDDWSSWARQDGQASPPPCQVYLERMKNQALVNYWIYSFACLLSSHHKMLSLQLREEATALINAFSDEF